MANRYLRSVFAEGWQEFNRFVFVAHKVIPAILSAPVTAFYLWLLYQKGQSHRAAMLTIWHGLLSLLLAYATVLVLIWLWYFITAPGRLHKKEQEVRKEAETEVGRLNEEKASKQILELVLENEAPSWTCVDPQRGPAIGRIGVKNVSTSKTVDEVCLMLTAIQNIATDGDMMKMKSEFGATGRQKSVLGAYNVHSHYVATMRVKIHAGEVVFFDVFTYLKASANQRHFIIREHPDVSAPPTTLVADESKNAFAWLLTFKTMGTDVAPKERVFKLESEGQKPPKFFAA